VKTLFGVKFDKLSKKSPY